MRESKCTERNPGRIITDIYISIMFLFFPLFTGFSGYTNITLSKYLFFIIATALWLVALLILLCFKKLPRPSWKAHHWAALVFAGICCLSFALSPHRSESLVGAGRYDGLITQLLYVCIFLGVSLFAAPRKWHFACLGLSLFICSALAIVQLFNVDILRLFRGAFSYYDAGIKYSGAYLGTMGNTNVLSAFYCLALPCLLGFGVLSHKKAAMLAFIPLAPACFVLVRAGVSAGAVALAVCALVSAPLVLSDINKLRRCLVSGAFCLVGAALALAFSPEYGGGSFDWSFSFGTLPLALMAAAALLLFMALILRLWKISISPGVMRKSFLCLSLAAVLLIIVCVYFTPAAEGTVFELSQVLRGKVDDSFGSSRIYIWRECLKLFPAHPLLGSGPDTLAARVNVSFSRYVEETGRTLRSGVDNAHNEYLGYLINLGLAGLAAYLVLLILGLRAWLRTLAGPMPAALGMGCLCYSVQSFFALGLPLVSPLFWIALALLFASSNNLCKPIDRIEEST